MTAGIGELAAFGTAFAWAVSSYTYSTVGRTVGANEITLLRLPFQLMFLTAACFSAGLDNALVPGAIPWLILSALTGAAVGDLFLYRAIMIVGPAIGILLLSLNASFTALFGWLLLGELLPMRAVAGIVLATMGVAWVVTGRSETALLPGQEVPRGKRLAAGAGMAIAAGALVAISFIFLKIALQKGVSPVWAAYIRVMVAALVLWGAGLFTGWSKRAVKGLLQTPRYVWVLTGASFFGGGGMWLSSLAMKMAPAGVAATIIALQPIMVTFLGAVLQKRAPSARIITGSIVAFLGTALVCLR